MRRLAVLAALAWAFVSVEGTDSPARPPTVSVSPPASPAASVRFRPYETAVRESRAQQKPLLLVFTNPRCLFCYAFDSQIFERPDTAGLINRYYIPVKLIRKLGANDNVPETREAARLSGKYGVNSTPRLIVVSPAGGTLANFGWSTRLEVIHNLQRHFTPVPE